MRNSGLYDLQFGKSYEDIREKLKKFLSDLQLSVLKLLGETSLISSSGPGAAQASNQKRYRGTQYYARQGDRRIS